MPNAQQYREAAARYRLLGEQFVRQAALVSGWPAASHLGAGSVADAVVRALGGSAANLVTAGDELSHLARVCEIRASVCDDYRRRVLDHGLLDPVIRRVVPRPAPPHPWVSL